MEEYSGLTDCMKLMLDKAEELDWSCTVYIEPTQKNRTYVEMSKFSPEGEDFGMIIDFDRTRQCKSFIEDMKDWLENYDVDEHAEMWIDSRGRGGCPGNLKELIEDAEAIEEMVKELLEALQQIDITDIEPVGKCIVEDGEIAELEKEFYGQGYIFKDWEAYSHRPDDPCYVPELSDTVYTANDILGLCNNQKEFADEIFGGVDWQHPESLFDDWYHNGEWKVCKNCGHIADNGCGEEVEICPECGADMED